MTLFRRKSVWVVEKKLLLFSSKFSFSFKSYSSENNGPVWKNDRGKCIDVWWNAKKGEVNVASRPFVVVFVVVGNIDVFVFVESVVFRRQKYAKN